MIGPGVAIVAAIGVFAQVPEPVATATISTATVAEGDDVDRVEDLPLSEEDLALMQALESGTPTVAPPLAAAPVERPRFDPRVQRIERRRLLEVVPRTVIDATLAEPAMISRIRRELPAEQPAIRGRTGSRVAVTLDGVRLIDSFADISSSPLLAVIDPILLDEIVIRSGPSLTDRPRHHAGALELTRPLPGLTPGVRGDAQAELRSNDRSAGVHGAVEGGFGFGGLRVAGSFSDFGDPRLGPAGDETAAAHQRVNTSARAQLLGRMQDSLRIVTGADFDRLVQPHALFRLEPTRQERSRLAAFARVDAGDAALGASLFASHQSHRWAVGDDGALGTLTALSSEARLGLHWAPVPEILLRAGGHGAIGSLSELRQEELQAGASAGVRLELGALEASVDAAVLHQELDPKDVLRGELSDLALLTEGRAELALAGPLALTAGWSQGARMPTLFDAPALGPERSLTADAGPILRFDRGALSLLGFSTWSSQEVRIDGRFVSEELQHHGLESRGEWQPGEQVWLAGALTWTSEREEITALFPLAAGLVAQLDLRYELGFREAFVQTSLRAALPAMDARAEYVVLSARGGFTLTRGFTLLLALDNVLDKVHRTYGSAQAEHAIDLRVALRYDLE